MTQDTTKNSQDAKKKTHHTYAMGYTVINRETEAEYAASISGRDEDDEINLAFDIIALEDLPAVLEMLGRFVPLLSESQEGKE